MAANLAAYGLDGEGSISSSDSPAYTYSNNGSGDSDNAELVGDYEHYGHSGNYGQEMMQPFEQELPPMTADHAYLLPGYEHTDSDVANMSTYLQDNSYGYFPESSRSASYDPIIAMHGMPRGWNAPNDGYMGQSFQGPEHFGAVPLPMVQHGLLDTSPVGQQLQPINQFHQHHSEERRGSTSDDSEDDVPLMLRLQQRATSHQSTGDREAVSDRNVYSESTLSEDEDQTYDSLPQKDPASAVRATVPPKSKDNARAATPHSDAALDIDWKLAKVCIHQSPNLFESAYQSSLKLFSRPIVKAGQPQWYPCLVWCANICSYRQNIPKTSSVSSSKSSSLDNSLELTTSLELPC